MNITHSESVTEGTKCKRVLEKISTAKKLENFHVKSVFDDDHVNCLNVTMSLDGAPTRCTLWWIDLPAFIHAAVKGEQGVLKFLQAFVAEQMAEDEE